MPRTEEAPDAMLTIELVLPVAFARSSMPGRKARIVRCIDFTLRSKEKSQSFSRGGQHRAVMHEAGDIDQDVDLPDLRRIGLDCLRRQHVELAFLARARPSSLSRETSDA